MVSKKEPVKAKVRVPKTMYHVGLEYNVEILKRGHFPDTLIVKLPDGSESEVDQAYLAKVH